MSSFSNPKINPLQGYILCISGTFALGQISGVVILIAQAKRDALISTTLGCLALFLYAFWIYRIVNKLAPNQSFLDLIELKLGSWIAWAVRGWIVLYLFFDLFVIHKSIVTWVKSMILPFTPIWAISLPLLIVCAYLAVKGIKPIAITLSILVPGMLVLIMFMAVFTFKHRQLGVILPLFSEGARPILEGAATIFGIGMEWFLLLLISPHIEGKLKWKPIAVIWSSMSIIIFNGVMGLLTTFGPYEASKMSYPVYTQWRMVNISSYVEHLDFLSMNQWLSNTAILISLGLFIIGDVLTSKERYKKIMILIFTTALFIGVELQINDTDFIAFTRYYFYPLSTGSVLVWTALAYLTSRKRGLS